MPQQIEEMITPVLAWSRFKFLSISMVNAKPDLNKLEPTYMTDIKIKIQNMKTRRQTSEIYDPYFFYISNWYQMVIPKRFALTLPIFVIEPGKGQFNYSAITFEHNVAKETVTI